jgi:hypothetical protein
MNADQLLKKRYVQASDIGDQGKIVTIVDLKIEELKGRDGTVNQKGVLYFDSGIKPLPLNNTNVAKLKELFGKETDDWIGKDIYLVVRNVEAFGKPALGIRIEETEQAPKKKSKK